MTFTKLNNTAIIAPELKNAVLKVYAVICAHANNKTHKTRLKKKTIQKESGYSETTVRRAIATLKKAGYMQVAERFNAQGSQLCHEYTVIFNDDDALTGRHARLSPVGTDAYPITRLKSNYKDITKAEKIKKNSAEYEQENIQAQDFTADELASLEEALQK